MAKALGFVLKFILGLTMLGAAAFGVAWLTADRWSGEVRRGVAEAGLPDTGWPVYAGDPGGSHFSDARQINRDTVGRLAPVWVFRTGETGEGYTSHYKHTFQATPILVRSTLYFATAFNRVFAIDAESGA
jgi:glucose dehydrogenase